MKYRILILAITLLTISQAWAQKTLLDRSGVASFFSEAPMEDIEAINKEALGALEIEKGTLAVSMMIKGFHFGNSLMEEHFNENYLESEKYPKATFKGRINNFSTLDLTKTGIYEVEVQGDMEIHGVKRPLTTMVQLEVSPAAIKVSTIFEISIVDHDIKTPTLVIKNIAEIVEVKALFNFTI